MTNNQYTKQLETEERKLIASACQVLNDHKTTEEAKVEAYAALDMLTKQGCSVDVRAQSKYSLARYEAVFHPFNKGVNYEAARTPKDIRKADCQRP